MGVSGGRVIHADLRSSAPLRRSPIVIVAHGFLGYKRWGFFPYLSERLAERGFHVCTFSFSMCGVDESTGVISDPDLFAANTISAELEDMAAVLRWASGGGFPFPVDTDRIGVLGHSRGGAVALIALAELGGASSLVTWSTPSRLDRYTERRKRAWRREGALVFRDDRSPAPLRLDYGYYEDIARNGTRFDLPGRAGGLAVPHLMIHGERDAAVTLLEARELVRIRRTGRAVLEVIPGCGHLFGVTHPMKGPTHQLDRAVSSSCSWLVETLGDTGKEDARCAAGDRR